MKKYGDLYTLSLLINDTVILDFIVDSGASEISIPAEVFLTLVRSGTVSDADFLPGRTYTLADGSTVKSNRFRLHSLRIGSSVLHDLTASIGSVGGPMLVGQNFLSRLGMWSQDAPNGVFTFAGEGVSNDQAPTRTATGNYSILIVTDPTDSRQELERQLIVQDLSRMKSELGVTVYSYDYSDQKQRKYCEEKLSIGPSALPLIAVVECRGKLPTRIRFDVSNFQSPLHPATKILNYLRQNN